MPSPCNIASANALGEKVDLLNDDDHPFMDVDQNTPSDDESLSVSDEEFSDYDGTVANVAGTVMNIQDNAHPGKTKSMPQSKKGKKKGYGIRKQCESRHLYNPPPLPANTPFYFFLSFP